MIEIVPRDGPPEAMNCPAFICDACRKQVIGQGNIVWMRRYIDRQPQSSPLYVAHKGDCDRRIEAALEQRYTAADGWTSLWEEAGDFLHYLTNNLTQTFADDPDGRYLTQTIVT